MSMTIGEISKRSGVPAKTIRYYEEIGLVAPPARGTNQYRAYGEDDLAMLRFVGRARRLGFSIEDLKGLVALYRDPSRSSRDVKALALHHLERIEAKIAELKSLRGSLTRLVDQCCGDSRPNCPIIEELSEPVRRVRPRSANTSPPVHRRGRKSAGAQARA
jgi:Cu(I)-responsive transcriptional regulator